MGKLFSFFYDLKDFQIDYVRRKNNSLFSPCSTNSACLRYKDKLYICSEHTYRLNFSIGEFVSVSFLKDVDNPPFNWDNCEHYSDHYAGYDENIIGCLLAFIEDIPNGSVIRSSREGEYTLNKIKDAMHVCMGGFQGRKKYLLRKLNERCAEKNITLDLSEWYNEIKSKTFIEQRDNIVSGYMRDPFVEQVYVYKVVYMDDCTKIIVQRHKDR